MQSYLWIVKGKTANLAGYKVSQKHTVCKQSCIVRLINGLMLIAINLK